MPRAISLSSRDGVRRLFHQRGLRAWRGSQDSSQARPAWISAGVCLARIAPESRRAIAANTRVPAPSSSAPSTGCERPRGISPLRYRSRNGARQRRSFSRAREACPRNRSRSRAPGAPPALRPASSVRANQLRPASSPGVDTTAALLGQIPGQPPGPFRLVAAQVEGRILAGEQRRQIRLGRQIHIDRPRVRRAANNWRGRGGRAVRSLSPPPCACLRKSARAHRCVKVSRMPASGESASWRQWQRLHAG